MDSKNEPEIVAVAGPEIVPIASSTAASGPTASASAVTDPYTGSSLNVASGSADASNKPVASLMDVASEEKQGAKCCRCCCDMRRAVIVLSIIIIILSAISCAVSASGAAVGPTVDRLDFDDDKTEDEVRNVLEDGAVREAIVSGVSLAVAIIALVGAIQYNLYLVGLQALWLLISYILSVVFNVLAVNDANDIDGLDETVPYNYPGYIISAIITALFIYPHIGLMLEIKSGVMSAATYPREKFSCCCD